MARRSHNVNEAQVESFFQAARGAQATRNDLIQLLSNPDIRDIVKGTFVRVLLELQDSTEDYMIARVEDVEQGEQYSGFSQVMNQATTLHLRLELPPAIASGNGNLYQLNSISNSGLTKREVETWLSLFSGNNYVRPTDAELATVGNTLRAAVPRRTHGRSTGNHQHQHPNGPTAVNPARAPAVAAPSPSLSSPTAVTSSSSVSSGAIMGNPHAINPTTVQRGNALSATTRQNAQPGDGVVASPARSAAQIENLPDKDTLIREQMTQRILRDLEVDHTVFRRNVPDMRTSELRTLERDVMEYIDRVRAAITVNLPRCIVCMDQVPTVIIMPCRHRLLCRWCALQVTTCPMCRGVATELFEPVEI